MSQLSNFSADALRVNGSLPHPAASVNGRGAPQPVEAPPAVRRLSAGTDRVELSDMARYLSRLNELPEIRAELVERVRAEIAAGRYETPEKLEAAITGILEEFDAAGE